MRAVEPGYAVVGRDGIVTGTQAWRRARLEPRQASNRFWSSLSLEAGSGGVAGARNAAELAFAQLSDLWDRFGGADQEVIFVVPSHYQSAQLGLLLGIATTDAHAYLDPGTGSMILQVLLGGVAGVMLAGKLYWQKFLSLIGVRRKADDDWRTREGGMGGDVAGRD